MAPDHLSNSFRALAAPTRSAILVRLASERESVAELGQPFAMSLPAISKQLKVLEHTGIIERGRDAQWRSCRQAADCQKDTAEWLDECRRLWEERLDRLDNYLCELQKKEKNDGCRR